MSPTGRRLRSLALISLLAAVAACHRVPPADLSRDPTALLEQVQAAQARARRVRGSARVHISSPQLSGTITEFIAAEKPDRLRLETVDFFGNPAAVLVSAGGRFEFLDTRANVLYRGEASPENVSRLLPVVLPVEELVTILCGSAPILPGKPLEVAVDGGLVLLTIGRGDLGQRVAVGEHASIEWSRIRRIERTPTGTREVAPAYDLSFGLFRERGGVRFPTEFELDAPAGHARVELAWQRDLEVNGPIDPALFHVEARGARVVDLPPGATLPPSDEPPPARRE